MKKLTTVSKRVLSVLLVPCAFGLMGVDRCDNDAAPKAVQITLLHTNDIHSRVRPAKADPFGLGGVARLGTLLKSLRQKNPVSLTLDGGDYSEGSWYYSADTGTGMLKILNALKYDAVALGNHDFLMGPDHLIRTIRDADASFPVLAANLDVSHYERAEEFKELVRPSAIQEIGGLKVGFIGLTTLQFAYNHYLEPVVITELVDAATAQAKALRPQVDLLVLMSHNNFDMNMQIAKNVPGVDAVISGHSHKKVAQAVFVTNAGRQVPVVETDQWAAFVGELKLSVTPRSGSNAPVMRFLGYQLHPVSPDLEEDAEIAAMVVEYDRALERKFGRDVVNEVIGHAHTDVLGKGDAESPRGNLAVKAYRDATGADISVDLMSMTGVDIARGPVTMLDAHDVSPHIYDPRTDHEWKLRLWNAKGSDIAVVFGALFTINGYMAGGSPTGWFSTDNVTIIWDLSALQASGERGLPKIKSILIGGVPLEASKRYKIAITDGVLLAIQMANDLTNLGLDLSDIRDSGVEGWQSVVNYVKKVGEISAEAYAVGGRTYTQGPDAAIYYYGISWDGSQLTIEVQNQGLKSSAPGTVSCSAGIPDGYVAYATELQEWTRLGEAAVPGLMPGAKAKVTIPWSSQGLAKGRWPLRCGLTVDGDEFERNNGARKIVEVR